MKINKEILLTILLVVLVIVSAVQAIQLNILSKRAEIGSFVEAAKKTSSASSTPPTGTGGSQLPQNLQNLPKMVGGC